jgi:hypothetical protein
MAAAARTAYWTRSRPKDRFSEDLAVFGTLVASREVLFHALRSYIYTASCNHVEYHSISLACVLLYSVGGCHTDKNKARHPSASCVASE